MPCEPSGEASIFSIFGFIEPKPQRQKKSPSFEGLGGGEPAWNNSQTGGRVFIRISGS
jgi:hypothetical protein